MMNGFETANRRQGWGVVLTHLLAALLMVAQAFASPSSSLKAESHKLQVSDPAIAKQIEAEGGRLIADYGSYRLYETPAQVPPKLLANPLVETRDGYNLIRLHAGELDTRKSQVKALRQARGSFLGKQLHLVQFAGPVQSAWRAELLAMGVQIISHIPENTYLVYGDAPSLARVQALGAVAPHIQWEGAYRDEYKIHPHARMLDAHGRVRTIGTDFFDIQLVADATANAKTLQLLERLKLDPIPSQKHVLNYLNVVVRLNPQDLARVAAQPEVVAILPYFPREKLCERQDQIIAGNLTGNVPSGPGYLAWLTSVGFTQAQFTASGFAVDVSDSGVDNGSIAPAHFGLYTGGDMTNASRVIYARYEQTSTYSTNSLHGCDGHGTINAHIIGGYDDLPGFPFADTNGFHYGLGVCPFVNIGSSVIFDSVGNDAYYFPNYDNLQSEAYHDGARLSNNSWGSHDAGAYNSDAQNYDALVRDAQAADSTYPVAGNQPMVIVFAAGNDGPNAQTMNPPGSAKNVISVGAAENVQPFGGNDRSQIPDSAADSANDIASFSSRGPCADGRIKPDLMAPGTHVSGGVAQATNDFLNYPDGIADPCFSGNDVSGGPGIVYWPDGQQFYTASSGTSHSAPCVAGGCALVLQYFLNNFSTNLPSPAMTKAYLINSARYLNGDSANDTLPSNNQGMGEMNLGMAFDGVARILRDQVPADLFTNSGQIRAVTGVIADTNQPFRVTVAWTDAPGSLSGDAYNNNLDLAVTVGGNTYKGNVFSNAYSVTGGAADVKNNVESVFLPAGVSGNFVVTVNGTSINSIGVPNGSNALCQDFALVVYNATPVSTPVVIPSGTTLDAESCTNGVIDSGETVTVDFALQNIGTADITNLVVTLQTNSGVLSVSAPQTYGAVVATSPAVSRPFTFKANGVCGGNITATLQLQDGTNNLGTINFHLPLGQLVLAPIFTQNFDLLTVPALPLGWTSSATGAQSAWITGTNASDTLPSAAFVGDPDMPGLSILISPVIPIATASAQLTFMNNYDLEASPSESASPATAYDGGVLEIQINGGDFVDIISAGGSFVTGGYTAAIPLGDDNPLDGRWAWSGNSGGFIYTVINLPAAVAGQNIQLRWLCGTDSGNADGGSGWYIDSITILDGYYTCCNPLVAPAILNPQISGTNLTFSFQTVADQTYSVQYKSNLTDPTWTTLQSLTGDGSVTSISDSLIVPQRFYRILSP